MKRTQVSREDLIFLYHGLNLSQRKIAKMYNIDQSTVCKLMKRYNIVTRKNKKVVDFNKKKTLSYILGVVKGDGWLIINKKLKRYEIGLRVVSSKFALEFLKSLKEVGLKPRTRMVNNRYYEVLANGKSLCMWIKNIDLNEYLKDEEQKIQFLKGFYESEGCCYDRIRMFNTDRELMQFVFKILKDLGFHPKIKCRIRPKYKPIYVVSINRRGEIERFFKMVKPVIKNKLKVNKVNSYVGGR